MRYKYCNLPCCHFFIIPCISLMCVRKLFANFFFKMFRRHKRNTCIFIGSWSEVFIGLQHSTVASTVDASSTGCTTCQRGSFSQIASRIGKLVAVELLQTVHCLVWQLYAQCSLQNPGFKLYFFLANCSKNSQGNTANRAYAVLLGSHTLHLEICVVRHQRVKLGYNKYRHTPISEHNTFKELQQLHETTDNTEHCM